MALSLILRNAGCSRQISQQLRRLTTIPSPHHAVTATLPLKNITITEAKSTPILNSVRLFTTTQPRLSGLETPHDHSRLWVIEKAVTVLMVPLVPAMLLFPNKILDIVVSVLITAHSFWGLEAIAVDYVRASIFGPLIPKLAIALVYLVCIATLGGLFYLISHDVGVANAVRTLWSVRPEQKA